MKLEELIDDLRNFKHKEHGYEISHEDCNMLVEYIDLLQKAFSNACEELGNQSYKIEMAERPYQYDCDYKDSKEWENELLISYLKEKGY